ncbi:AMP-binding protein [Pseudonocardia asaccharolytica]|uniref:Fatty-acyl-CoA synthase n=1 Tax=Pseudonocardia asaccharolytica DSM 44247 = NBRC 16224 TaxID=1123024 RepID=A0A511CZI3_9PSEU|nr:AMP-binding protein [Pseudonocardia asaccharolytica]GEL17877.1 fatty-acyl-CoA synthase [Pseudonocardia asaccharolytica DSM 44247 = NBRC 16224]
MSQPLLPALLDPSDRPALTFPDGELTYAQLATAATELAGALAGRARVAVWATPTLPTAVGVVAALMAGVPVVPINPRIGERELEHVVSDAAPDTVLAAPDAELPAPLTHLSREPGFFRERVGASCSAPPHEPAPDAPAFVIYTSGTTGPPKGAVHTRAAIAANLDALADVWAWTDRDRLAHALPLFHVHGLVLGVLGPLRRGGSLHHLGGFDAAGLAAAVSSGATMVFGVPTHYHRLADELAADPDAAAAIGRARLLVSGSAALTAVDHARIEKATGLAVRERYGLTETLILTAARADDEAEPGTVGRPLPGTEVRLAPLAADPDAPVGDDELGAVEVRGPGLFSGYLNRPDATAAAHTPDGWFATGDIGRWTLSGSLALVGRMASDLIKSGGYKIGAGEIENALLEYPGVAEAAVIGVPDDDLGERVVAVVVPAGEPPTARTLIDHVAALLAPHKRPREIRFVEALPRNDMGKVQKRRL